MDFIDNILGSAGCHVDGTMTNNPVLSFLDAMYDQGSLSGANSIVSSQNMNDTQGMSYYVSTQVFNVL